jgi:hypothetical protein
MMELTMLRRHRLLLMSLALQLVEKVLACDTGQIWLQLQSGLALRMSRLQGPHQSENFKTYKL